MSALPNPFLANDDSGSPETNFRASLDLSGAPAGSYYFNKENNFNYTKNWFNYSKFDVIEQDSVINEIAQYSSVPIEVGELDSNKVYQLPSTTMTPQWITRIQGDGNRNAGQSGVDFAGNTYLMFTYSNSNADVYDANNNLVFSENPNGFSRCITLAKFNTAGVALWSVRIRGDIDCDVDGLYCVSDNQGTTYIAGNVVNVFVASNLVFENAANVDALTIPVSANTGFLVAYTTFGVPDWATLTSAPIRVLAVDNQTIGNVYGVLTAGGTFYDPSSFTTPVLTVPTDASLVVAKWRSSSGLFQWASYLTGYRVFLSSLLVVGDRYYQSLACSPEGNIYVTAYYTEIASIFEGRTPTETAWIASDFNLPPYSKQVVWIPREQERAWADVCVSQTGQYMYAIVQNGFIYSSTDYGVSWNARATTQQWSSVWCTGTGQYVIATIEDSVIYVSGDYGVSWSIALGEGSNARAWSSVCGKPDGSAIVACALNDKIYRSTDLGSTWSVSTSPTTTWVDMAYSARSNYAGFVAVVKNGGIWRSTDDGVTWISIGPVGNLNWSGVCADPYSTSIDVYPLYATIENGVIYQFVSLPPNWVIVNSTPRKWSAIARNTLTVFATEFDGSIYQANVDFPTEWTPVTIPRDWNRVAMTADYALACVSGGQLYTSSFFYPVKHTLLVKYNPEGVVQWTNYVNCPSTNEDDNTGVCLTTQSNGQVILSGIAGTANEFFAATNFETPIKVLNTNPSFTYYYLACYSPEGVPLWVAAIQGTSLQLLSMSVDELDNIYCVGNARTLSLYNPTNQLAFTDSVSFIEKTVLLKYYPNGFVQSYAYLTFGDNTIGPLMIGSYIRALGQGQVYLSGALSNIPIPKVLAAYAQVGGPIVRSVTTSTCVFASKYSSSTLSWFTIPNPGYNLVFQPQFSIGGSTRYLIDGYTGDGAIELWGGKTGLLPSAIDTADLNASVISYLGHQPGYTIPVVEGLQTFSPKVYSHLVVGLSEPSFPTMDPQPVTPGTIPYGFLPIYAVIPTYTTGLVLNNSLNDNTNAILSTTGTVSNDALMILGLYVGDKVRILLFTSTTAQYVTLTVAGFIDSETVGNVLAAVRFEESTRYVCKMLGSTTNATASLIVTGTARYAPMFWQPVLVQEGTLNLVVQLYPQSIS